MPTEPPGIRGVRLARETLEREIGGRPPAPVGPPWPPLLEERRGVFVTLRRHPTGGLRGCIGFPRGGMPLFRAIPEATLAAAREDPRFRPLGADEVGAVTVELSILTPPELLPADEAGRRDSVRVGRDGLIVERYGTSGLLLPQVAPEQGWEVEEFLDGTCEKAGLPPGAWRDPRLRLYRFRAEIFAEATPRGEITERPSDDRPAPTPRAPPRRSGAPPGR